MDLPWEAIVGAAVPTIGALFWAYHSVDKRLDRLESDCRMIAYQLEVLQSDVDRRGGRLKQAIYEITQWLQKRGFTPRSQTTDGPWPSADPPTQSFSEPKGK